MCGKFEVLTIDDLSGIITAIEFQSPLTPLPDWPARFPSVVPGDEISVIVPAPGTKLGVRKLVWGYDAPWDNHRGLAFNSRIERADDPGMWANGFESGRIIVAAPAFYESDTKHKPHRFTDANQGTPLLMAGIAEGNRFSLVTCPADETVGQVHDRMPMVLDSAAALQWLEVGTDIIRRASAIPLRRHGGSAPLPEQLSLF